MEVAWLAVLHAVVTVVLKGVLVYGFSLRANVGWGTCVAVRDELDDALTIGRRFERRKVLCRTLLAVMRMMMIMDVNVVWRVQARMVGLNVAVVSRVVHGGARSRVLLGKMGESAHA